MIRTGDSNSSHQNQATTRHKVLLVDDVLETAGIVENLRNALPADRFEVVGADSITPVKQRLREEPLPTVIVIDIYLPDDGGILGGARLAEHIREGSKNLKLLETPIIAYSNFAYWIFVQKKATMGSFARVRREMRKRGVYDFIDKNKTDGGEPNPRSINSLAVRIEQIVSSLERGQ